MDHAVLIAALRDIVAESLERERRFMPPPYRDANYEARAYRAIDAANTELVRLNDPRKEPS